jgi:hypothetical protein
MLKITGIRAYDLVGSTEAIGFSPKDYNKPGNKIDKPRQKCCRDMQTSIISRLFGLVKKY